MYDRLVFRGSRTSHVKKLRRRAYMKSKTMAVNGVIAALYVAVSILITPFGFLLIQFRVSEIFNHLIVFNKKYFFGIVTGVFVANLILSPIAVDIFFGVLHSAIALSITMISAKFIQNITARMIVNTIVFSLTMFIIAFQLMFFADIPEYNGMPFYMIYGTLALSECIVMLLGTPIFKLLNKRIDFSKLI